MNASPFALIKKLRILVAPAFLLCGVLCADTVETTDGSRLHGKIVSVDGGIIEIETPFAGVLQVRQDSVVSFSTETAVNVRFTDGNTVIGTVAGDAGQIKVNGGSVSAAASIASVTAAWLPGNDSPEVRAAKAAESKWGYEASVDVLGKSGNSDNIAGSVSAAATLISPRDKLRFYASYARADQDGTTTANQAKGGIDFSTNFSGKYSWYVREEIGTDKIQDLSFYSNTAAGMGFDAVKKDNQVLTLRAGLAYRFESYEDGSSLNVPAADIGVIHDYTASTWKVGNRITFLPSFSNFSNYRVLHDSFFEMPLAAGFWKIRFGVANDYNSEPQPGKTNLDTTYYTKLVLNWQ